MARTPSMSPDEALSEIKRVTGKDRGHLFVNSENRRLVRKWLTARGLPASFVAGLSNMELAKAFNKESEYLALSDRARDYVPPAGSPPADSDDTDSVPPVPPVPPVPNFVGSPMPANAVPQGDAASQLAGLIASIAGASLSVDTVRSIVDAEIKKAFEGIPSIRITVRHPDEIETNLEGHQHPKFVSLLKACTARKPDGHHLNIWLSGPTGSGKTHAAEQIAKALNRKFYYNGSLSMAFEVLGFVDAGGKYHRTAFREAFEHGGVYLFDEVDGCDSNQPLLALSAALANGVGSFPDGIVKRHPDFLCLAAANTFGLGATADYVGRAKIDAAFLARFPTKIMWDYDAGLESVIAGNEQWARQVQAARARARSAGLKVIISPRTSIDGAALISAGFTPKEAAEMTYLAGLTPEQVKIIEGV